MPLPMGKAQLNLVTGIQEAFQAAVGDAVVVIAADQRHFPDALRNQQGRHVTAGTPVIVIHAEDGCIRGGPDNHKGDLFFFEKSDDRGIDQAAHGNDSVDLPVVMSCAMYSTGFSLSMAISTS